MAKSQITDTTVREYLLGRVSDETMLETIEEKLFADEEFCSQVELAEDGLINDYVRGHMNATDAGSFQSTLATDSERRVKVELTQALRERSLARDKVLKPARSSVMASLAAFFRQPQYAGAFVVLLIGVLILAVYLTRKSVPDDLAELRSLYQQSRPTETRISEFEYAPLSQLRGPIEPAAQTRLRLIENRLIEATGTNPSPESYHALGIFYLTQQKFPDAIQQFQIALKLSPQNAKLHNDLGSTYFELAKTKSADKQLEDLSKGLEEFSRATELDGNLLEALFNKSLTLQELGLKREAKESWTLFLQKDPNSPWAEEARKNLARLDAEQTQFKSDADVLTDFLIAFQNRDEARAQRIHNETKGLLRGPMVPLQLSRRYLVARQEGRDGEARESLAALNFIGLFEYEQHGESFFVDFANAYERADTNKISGLLEAKAKFASGQQVAQNDYAKAISEFEASRDLFARFGSACEAAIAEIWAVQFLPDVARIAESRSRLAAIIQTAERKNHKVLSPPAYYWLGISDYLQNELSRSRKNLRTALQIAEASENTFEVAHVQDALAVHHFKLGEVQSASFYASRMLAQKTEYFETRDQWLRSQGTLADITLTMNRFSTSLSFSREVMSAAQELSLSPRQMNDSLRRMIVSSRKRSDFGDALRYAQDSMQIALSREDSAEKRRITAEVYGLLGDLKREMKNYDGALSEYDQALNLYRALPELTFGLYAIHKGRLFCFQQLQATDQFSMELRTVLDLSEQYRQNIREDESRQAFFANEAGVFDVAIEHSLNQHDRRQAFTFAETSRSRSLLEFVKSGKSIAEIEKDFGSVAQPLTLEEIQSRLPEEAQLVEYAVLPDKLAIWILSRARLDLVEKKISAAELENEIQRYQASLTGRASARDLKGAAQRLYELLIPVNLVKGKQLFLLPDKFLHQLAFATLVSPEGKHLLEDYPLVYAASASIMVLATENARSKEHIKGETLLAVGNPDFDREENPGLPDLRSAADEARTIAGNYGETLELIGARASKESFLQNFLNAEVIHFAGHFVANRQSPGNSKLLFAQGELRSSELSIYRVPKAKLVLMSACETGLERYDESEGAIGIARTWMAMGAPLVVATQWRVDSEATRDLMIAFHRNRRGGMNSAESLRQAQLDSLKSEKTGAPFYWGAFAMFGGYATY